VKGLICGTCDQEIPWVKEYPPPADDTLPAGIEMASELLVKVEQAIQDFQNWRINVINKAIDARGQREKSRAGCVR
jgi:hypothetical protein